MRAKKSTRKRRDGTPVAAEGKAIYAGMDNPLSPLFPQGPEAFADWLFRGFFDEGPGEREPVTLWLLPGGRVQ